MSETRLVEVPARVRADDDFRRYAVRTARASDKPVPAVAKQLGVGHSTLYRWLARFPDEMPDVGPSARAAEPVDRGACLKSSGVALPTDENAEVARLRKEVSFLRDENVILRRAAMTFARTAYPSAE